MDDNNTNIQELKEKVFQFVKQRDWEKFHNPKNLAISIAIEASELMEILGNAVLAIVTICKYSKRRLNLFIRFNYWMKIAWVKSNLNTNIIKG